MTQSYLQRTRNSYSFFFGNEKTKLWGPKGLLNPKCYPTCCFMYNIYVYMDMREVPGLFAQCRR